MSEIIDVNELSTGEEIVVMRGTETVFSGTVSSLGTSSWRGSDYADIEIGGGEHRSIHNNAGHGSHTMVEKGISYKGAVTVRSEVQEAPAE